LPTQLVEGFASTLEETLVADLVLHVVDASEPDERLGEMIASVEAVLHAIGADDVPREVVLNKIDRVDPLGRKRLANRFPDSLHISAVTGEGLDELRARIAQRFGDRYEDVRLLLPYEEGGKLAELYALGAPIDEREDSEQGVLVRARLPQREVRRFAPYLVADADDRPAAERG
jgi:GTPase